MQISYNLLLFALTFTGACIPLMTKRLNDVKMNYLLAFSGSFLLSITFLHLLPETFSSSGPIAGVYLLAGFFLQLVIQTLTHGIEHGHVHVNKNDSGLSLSYVLIGLTIHAFMEGLPLGVNYQRQTTLPSLYLAVAAHKLPEAMLAATLLLATKPKRTALLFLFLFSITTPVAATMASYFGNRYLQISQAVNILLPMVAGAFIHISTTIFFESGTKQHALTRQKLFAILLGLVAGLVTLIWG